MVNCFNGNFTKLQNRQSKLLSLPSDSLICSFHNIPFMAVNKITPNSLLNNKQMHTSQTCDKKFLILKEKQTPQHIQSNATYRIQL